MEKIGQGICNGSFGEILQGFLPGNKKFLVNVKIRNASYVTVTVTSCQYSNEKEAQYAESYRNYSKSYKIVRNILADLGRHDDCYLEVHSDIPIGKGLSSSTADMIASVRGLSAAVSIAVKPDYVARMVTEIEPNDGLHYVGTSAYHHTMGELIANFDYTPPLHILGIDLGGEVDTVQFNKIQLTWTEEEMEHYQNLLKEIQKTYGGRDLVRICQIATESARLWQKVRYKPELDRVLNVMEDTEALGVLNTHSGTYLGLLYPDSRTDLDELFTCVRNWFPDFDVRWFQTITCSSGKENGIYG